MSSANAASSPSISSNDAEPSTYIEAIQQNWSITSDEDILPASLSASVPFACLPTEIIQAVHELSTLTTGQRDRAHSLLTTYFQAHIREGSYSGKIQSIFAILEVGDVEKACDSVRRMTRGMELQGSVSVSDTSGKRKYSIRDELAVGEKERSAKVPRLALEGILEESEDDEITTQETSLPPLPFTAVENDQEKSVDLPPIPPTPRTKRRVTLPPIKTHALHTSILPASSAGFTPLFNNLKKEVGLSLTPSLYPNSYKVHQSIQPYQREVYKPPQVDARVQAAQRATHEFNVRRIELMEAQKVFEQARRRFEVARGRMDRARGSVGWR